MASDGIFVLFLLLVFLAGLVVLVVWIVRRQLQNTWHFTGLLADQCGMTLARRMEKHGMNDFPVLSGHYRNRRLDLYTHVVGSGKHRYRVTTLHVYCNTHPENTLSLWREGLFSKLGVALGMQDIQTGNIDFDQKFILRSHSPVFARSVFDYQTCLLAIDAHRFFSGSLVLKNGRFEYSETAVINNQKVCWRFFEMIKLAETLCRRVEAGTSQGTGSRAQ